MKAACTKTSGLTEKTFADGTKGLKSGAITGDNKMALTYTNEGAAKTVTFRLFLSVKTVNNEKAGFWKQGDNEKVVIKVNGNKITPPTKDINFKDAGLTVDDTKASDTGALAVPVWIDICSIDLLANAENTIDLNIVDTNYSFYFCGGGLANIPQATPAA